jgi:hypothetical protein
MHRTQNLTASAADTDDQTVITPADTLRGAARYLELRGWTQGDYYAFIAEVPFPPACVTGAIGMAAHGTRVESPTTCSVPTAREFRLAFHYLSGYLIDNDLIGDNGTDPDEATGDAPFCWNDGYGQTADNVIATLRAAADDWDWTHASEDDRETYAEICISNEEHPTREGFLAWLAASR